MNTSLWIITDGKDMDRLQTVVGSLDGREVNIMCWSGAEVEIEGVKIYTPEMLPCPIAHDTYFTANFNRILWLELSKITHDSVLIMNDDIEWEEGAFDKLMDTAERTELNWAHIEPVQVDMHNTHTVIMGGTGRAYPGGVHVTGNRDDIISDKVDRWKWLPFCSPLIRLDAVRAVGLLDPMLRMWFSDSDWCARARYAGFETILAHDAVIKHINHATAQAGEMQMRFRGDQAAFGRKWSGEILSDYSV